MYLGTFFRLYCIGITKLSILLCLLSILIIILAGESRTDVNTRIAVPPLSEILKDSDDSYRESCTMVTLKHCFGDIDDRVSLV